MDWNNDCLRSWLERFGFITNRTLLRYLRIIMIQIEDVQAKLDIANAALTEALPVVANISADVDNLTAQIAALVAGSLTPEQLAALTSAADSLNSNTSALADALTAVDAKTP